MGILIPKKLKESGCAHPGCLSRHKNSGGYCAEHANDMDRQVIEARQGHRLPAMPIDDVLPNMDYYD